MEEVSERRPAEPGRAMSYPVPGRFVRYFMASVARWLLLVLVLTEAIFLIESLGPLLKFVLDVHGGWSSLLQLLALTIPDGLDFALPIALLVSVYLTLLKFRESREFIVMAMAGMRAANIIMLLVGIGVAAQAVSFALSGFLRPYAQYASREIDLTARYDALFRGTSVSRFYRFPRDIVYVWARSDAAADKPLFIARQTQRDVRAIASQNATLLSAGSNGTMAIQLRDLTSLQHSDSIGQPHAAALPDENIVQRVTRARGYAEALEIGDLLRNPPRGAYISEQTAGELVQGSATPDRAVEFVRRLVRCALCFLAPLAAGLAITLTSGRVQMWVLPASCAVLMALDIVQSAVIRQMANTSLLVALSVMVAFNVAVATVVIAALRVRRLAMIQPLISRA